ncbi:MAG: divergent polysaccharide deacetylase family protein [Ketobacter sp.]|nr:divergent polysaccharide deacetylase family protein [Ketobacter sp.]
MLRITATISTLLLLLCSAPGSAAPSQILPEPTEELPKIAIILDDLGYNRHAGEQALQLPGNLTYAIIPFTPYSQTLAQAAHDRNREVILHLPMESSDPNRRLDEGGLTSELDEHEVKQRVKSALDSVPHIAGLNNHMGSHVTTNVQIMHWLMQEVQTRPLYFIDSMTNPHSVANRSAQHYHIPSLKRDVFLDNVQSEADIDRMFRSLVRIAHKRGHAIAIGHPYPATLAYLEKALPRLGELGVQLVDASELVMFHGQPVDQPIDLQEIMELIVAMPAPESQRLNFSD